MIRQALADPSVNSLTLAWDCLQESLEIEPGMREQLEEMLGDGLESEDPEIAKLAAEVKLSRRLNNLFEMEENLEIDTSYITCAEYQLFVDEWLNLGECFQAGSAKRPITGISYQNALGFCAWLSSKAQSLAVENKEDQGIYYYRLPTATEVQDYRAKEHEKLGCWNVGESNTEEKGIRVVKTKIPLPLSVPRPLYARQPFQQLRSACCLRRFQCYIALCTLLPFSPVMIAARQLRLDCTINTSIL